MQGAAVGASTGSDPMRLNRKGRNSGLAERALRQTPWVLTLSWWWVCALMCSVSGARDPLKLVL